jgi:hypothetical protein
MVNEGSMTVADVPNIMRHKMVFQVFSDLPMISAPAYVSVLPAQTASFPLTVHTTRRGVTKGVVMFVYDADHIAATGLDQPHDSDSDDEDTNPLTCLLSPKNSKQLPHLSASQSFKRPCRLWYSVEVRAIPGPAEKQLEMTAAVQASLTMELLIKNPLNVPLDLDVVIDNDDLHGNPTISLEPNQSLVYQVVYMPVAVGKSRGSVIFQSDSVGEFWYELSLTAPPPIPVYLPAMQCTLGGFCETVIQLHNVHSTEVSYQVSCSNTNNFSLGCSSEVMLQIYKLTLLILYLYRIYIRFIP